MLAAGASLPTVSIVATDASAKETLAGQTADPGLFTISRTGSTAKSLTVKYAIAGTAANAADYAKIGTSVKIAAGRSSATVAIAPIDDAIVEAGETVKLTLSSNSAYKVDSAKSTATVTLADNDTGGSDAKIAAIAREVVRTNSTSAVDSYEEFFSLLPVNQGDQRGYSKKTAQPDLVAARSTIFAELTRALTPAGGTVSYQDFSSGGYSGRNIVGVLPGQGSHKSQQYVIGVHYDSEQNPGADDDGSGVAGLLEAASVLAKHKFDATIVFVAFDQEEERSNGWGVGSQFFATSAKNAGTDIRGAIVLDMIAYNDGGDNIAVVGQSDSSSTSASAAVAGKIAQAFASYTTVTTQRMTGFDDTDGYRLYKSGFATATLIEQLDSSGDLLNPYYHEATDYYRSTSGQTQKYNGREYLDFAYATEMTKGTVAWAAGGAVVLDGAATPALAALGAAIEASGAGANQSLANPAIVSGAGQYADGASPMRIAPAKPEGQNGLAGQVSHQNDSALATAAKAGPSMPSPTTRLATTSATGADAVLSDSLSQWRLARDELFRALQ